MSGAGLLIATAAIHLDLYLTGYRTIPTIGWLFLLQVIAAFALGLAVLVIPTRMVIASRVAAVAGAGFALATLGGYLLTVWIGLFGFTEVRTSAGIVAGVIEIVAIAGPGRARAGSRAAGHRDGHAAPVRFPDQIPPTIAGAASHRRRRRLRRGAPGGGAGRCCRGGTGDHRRRTTSKTTTIGGVTVLTNAQGLHRSTRSPPTPRPPRSATEAVPRTGPR